MILFELQCTHGHRFEAWFRNGAQYDDARATDRLSCPVCGDPEVTKAPMAPRIAKQRRPAPEAPAAPPAQTETRTPTEPLPPAMPAADDRTREHLLMLRALRRQVETQCDYVGERFAEEARRMHYGETDARPIYGETSDKVAEDLREEGIAVRRIPWVPRADS